MILKYFLSLVFIISLNKTILGQKLKGEVIYKYRITSEFLKLDSLKQKNKEAVKDVFYSINESLKDYQDSFEYILVFDEISSNYYWKEMMGVEDATGIKYAKIFTKSEHFYYSNLKDSIILDQFDFFGKKIIVKRGLNEMVWKLSNESKQIGKYTCFKATTIKKTTKKNNDIEAWYTPQIPNGFGPKDYVGLPGLILELKEGSITYYVSSIKLNMKQNKIIEPKKGQFMTQEQLNNFFIEFNKSKFR